MMSKPKKKPRGWGSIRKKANKQGVSYEGRYRDADGIQHSISSPRRDEVEEMLDRVYEEKRVLEDENTVVKEAYRIYAESWKKTYTTHLKPETLRKYLDHLDNDILPYIGDIPVNEVSREDVQRMLNDLAASKSVKTMENILGVLGQTYKPLIEKGIVKRNPAHRGKDSTLKIPVSTKPPRAMRVLADDELRDFVEVLELTKFVYYREEIMFALLTGLRLSELCGLTWDRYDAEKGTLTIDRQHNNYSPDHTYGFRTLKQERDNSRVRKPRTIVLTAAAIKILEIQRKKQARWAAELGKEYKNPEGFIFTDEYGHYRINATLSKNCTRAAATIGVEGFRFHDLRHTYATNFLRAGGDVKVLQHNLGHFSASFTLERYAHATHEMEVSSSDKMDEFFARIIETKTTE